MVFPALTTQETYMSTTLLLVGDLISVDGEVHLIVVVNDDIIRTTKLKREHQATSGDLLLDCTLDSPLARTGDLIADLLSEMSGQVHLACSLHSEPMARTDFQVIGRCRDTDGVRMMLQHQLTGGFKLKTFPSEGPCHTVVITDSQGRSRQLPQLR